MRELLARLGLPANACSGQVCILLQEQTCEGITDVEIHAPDVHIVLEAKIVGWPKIRQLEQYRDGLMPLPGRRALCPLGVPPVSESPARRWVPGGGIDLIHLRWIDVLQMVQRVGKSKADELLSEYARLLQEVLRMQSYDREVLVRDVTWLQPSFHRFFRHNLYTCQASEISEPLFFAPCFSGDADPIHKGIHYFARVYCKDTLTFRDADQVAEALAAAQKAINDKVDVLAGRKGAAEEVAYLKSLPAKWRSGMNAASQDPEMRDEDEWAVFFLGAPMPLPRPLFKKGFMIPLGFSMSIEHLINGTEATFKC